MPKLQLNTNQYLLRDIPAGHVFTNGRDHFLKTTSGAISLSIFAHYLEPAFATNKYYTDLGRVEVQKDA